MRSDRIREFEIFLSVVELGSYSAAARRFELTPSAISKLIDRLETRLAVRLLHRTSRALSLTQEGRTFQHAAQRALEVIAEVETSLQGIGAPAVGTLRVHIETLNFAEYLLAPLLPKFFSAHPSLRVEFLLRNDYVDLTKEEYDVSIRRGPVLNPSLVAKPITTSHWILCASPEYITRAGMPVTVQELLLHNCLNFLPQMQRSTWPLIETRGEEPIAPTGNVATNSDNLLRQLALQGMGIICVTDFHVRADLESGRLLPVLQQHLKVEAERIYAVFQSRRHLSPRVRLFLEFLDNELRDGRQEWAAAGSVDTDLSF
jgi:DNA-binding transcriptional LysR family regulator